MKRMLVAVFVVLGAWVGVARAEETPEAQLDFVRKLRAKGYHDLTKEYIEQLIKARPALAGELGLEQARSLVAMAREKSLEQRGALFNQARELFQDFVKKYDKKPEAIQARLEMAKLVAYHGQTILAKALREEDAREQHEAARKAEPLFIQAGAELDIVIKQLEDKEQIQAKFERAVNILDQARTYIDLEKEATGRKRSELIDEARKRFVALATDEATDVGLLANAWLVKCNQELQDPVNAVKHLKRVVESKEKSAVPAQRLARYFYIQGIEKDPTIKVKTGLDKIKLIETEANKWIKDYGPLSIKTWEGQGVRFELANAILRLAQATFKDLKVAGAAPLLNQAQKLYTALADLDGEFSEEAKRRTIFIAVTKLEKAKLEDIRDFDNSLLKAQYEIYKVRETGRLLEDAKTDADKDKLKTAKKLHMRDTVRALSQALNLATSGTPLQKVDEARMLLLSAHYGAGDLQRAIVAAESLGRTRPPTKRAPQGVGVAFRAYDELGDRDDTVRQKARDLAEFVLSPESQKFWATEPVTAVAHYKLAMIHHKDKEFKEAIGHLEKLPADFGAYIFAQGQLTFMALAYANDTNAKLLDDERQALKAKARAALKRVPGTLPTDIDATTATMYYHSQMEEPKFLYADAAAELKAGKLVEAAAKYKEMGKFVEHHFDSLKKTTLKFEDKTQKDLTTMMTVLIKYSKLGMADVEYRLGNYDKVLSFDLVGPLVQQVKELAKKEGKIKVKDHVVGGEILGLALRTYVQKGDLENAKTIFDILERLAPEEDGGSLQADNSNMMFSLVADIEVTVKDLKKKGDAEKLKEAIGNYSKFIDDISGSMLKGSAEPRVYMFLANAYQTLEQPTKAAELFGKVAEPKSLNKKDKLTEEELKEVQNYWYLRIQYGKALREGKKYNDAYKVLQELLVHPNAQYHILAEMEKLYVLEDNATFGTAIKGWQALMNRLRDKAAEDNAIKKLYFECYFGNARCWYKYSQSPKVLKDGKEELHLTSAARYIVNLENAKIQDGWNIVGDRFGELMDAEPKLKAAYEKLKKSLGAAPSAK